MPTLTPAIRTPSGGRRFEYKLINVARQRKVRPQRRCVRPVVRQPRRQAGPARRDVPSAHCGSIAEEVWIPVGLRKEVSGS
jgi:hypothetical protein